MDHASIHDRNTLEGIYPRNKFTQDANMNARGNADVIHGVKILSAPDEGGRFKLVAAAQHVGEGDPESDTIFLVPQLTTGAAALVEGAYPAAVDVEANLEEKLDGNDDYTRFIDGIIQAAGDADFKRPIGAQEERLKGFRGG